MQNKMNLTELQKPFVSDLQINQLPEGLMVSAISSDSRKIQPGSVFFALSGTQTNGAKFIQQAVEEGAIAVVQEAESEIKEANIPVVIIPKLSQKLGEIAAHFYGNPTNQMTVVGITGTNGKTSCCYLLTQALEKLGKKTAMIGTLGNGPLNQLQDFGMTTPGAIELQQQFHEFQKNGIDAVVMEVSSHALAQDRVAGVQFDLGMFTNLTQDHLDYHKTMQEYAACKRRLIHQPGLNQFVVNEEDPEGQEWIKLIKQRSASVLPYSVAIAEPFFASSQLIGRFNQSNLAAVFSALKVLGYQEKQILEIIPQLNTVPGRLELIRQPNKPLVIIDYAHTPDALEKALQAVKETPHNKVICLFGCGGDRDKTKRPLMAAIAEQNAEQLVVTSDNPRTESPEEIIADVLAGLKKPQQAIVEIDREKAIEKAITAAEQNDIVLLAGKGHEDYQIIGKEKRHFSDKEIAEKYLN
jgi:UDP-N-acetylmuramoyl-L-alanyl-D-glutamate--2,6-diaminopimelate ligase